VIHRRDRESTEFLLTANLANLTNGKLPLLWCSGAVLFWKIRFRSSGMRPCRPTVGAIFGDEKAPPVKARLLRGKN